MKIYIPIWILSIAASLFLSTGLLAQEQIEMSIKVTKDGKVVKDTSYQFDDAAEAENAMKMMELMSGDELHKEHVTYNYTTAHSGHGEAKTMVFISEDGKTTEISEFHGDSLVDVVKKKEIIVMVSSDEEGNWTVVEGDEKMMDKDENVFIIKGDDDVKVKVMKIMEEEGDGENVKVIVITESGDLHEDHDEDHDVDHDHDSDHNEEVEVKVVKKKEKK